MTTIEDLRHRLATPGTRVLVLTGAGISAAAGLATYRGDGGLYPSGQLIPLQYRDATSRKVADLWGRIAPMTSAAREAAPTAAHRALAAAEARGLHILVATQNVDGLHARAGSTRVHDLHGSLDRARCLNPKCRRPATVDDDTLAGTGRCTDCNARLRPDLVLFGERLDQRMLAEAMWFSTECDVVLAVGTSLQVHPAAGLVANAVTGGAVGAWLERDPDTMRTEVDPGDRSWVDRLLPVPGDCQTTLVDLLDG